MSHIVWTYGQVPEKEIDLGLLQLQRRSELRKKSDIGLGLLQLGLQRRSWLRRPVVPIPLPSRAIDLHKSGEKCARG